MPRRPSTWRGRAGGAKDCVAADDGTALELHERGPWADFDSGGGERQLGRH